MGQCRKDLGFGLPGAIGLLVGGQILMGCDLADADLEGKLRPEAAAGVGVDDQSDLGSATG